MNLDGERSRRQSCQALAGRSVYGELGSYPFPDFVATSCSPQLIRPPAERNVILLRRRASAFGGGNYVLGGSAVASPIAGTPYVSRRQIHSSGPWGNRESQAAQSAMSRKVMSTVNGMSQR